MHIKRRASLGADGVHGPCVVEVPVGQQDVDALQTVLLQIVEDRRRVRAGVDHRAVQRRLVGDDVAVGLEGAEGKAFDEHGESPFR